MGEAVRCGKCGGEIPADAPAGACPRCALAAALSAESGDPTPDEVAAKLPAFDILGVLGRGGMGVVFKARQKALDRVVALKVLPPVTAAAPGFSERFAREAKAMARLQHPNIVAVHEFGEASGLFYLVLEFVDGLNVREAMRAERIGPTEALAIVPQICDALQYAHDRGVVHRDIKPENVLIDREGRVRIADFGLAKLADREAGDPSLTGASQVMGTLHYMAPEQWERPKDVDHRCDIYSLGVVFYEMLTGELPVGRFEPPSRRASIDVRIDEVVMRSLERDRERRWQRVDEVKTKVSAITSGPVPAAPRAPLAPTPAAAPTPAPPDLWQQMAAAMSWWPAHLPMFAMLILGVVGFDTGDAWCDRMALLMAKVWIVSFLVLHIARDAKVGAALAKSGVGRVLAALVPMRLSLPTHSGLLVAGSVAAAVTGFVLTRLGDTAGALIGLPGVFLVMVVIWMCERRAKAVRAAAAGTRGPVGSSMAIDFVAMVTLLAGVLAIGWARIDHGAGADAAEPTGQPPGDAGAPWDFPFATPKSEDSAHVPRESDRRSIWRTWTRAQAAQGEWAAPTQALYGRIDAEVIRGMTPEEREEAGAAGSLGAPLLSRDLAVLAKFTIRHARFRGWDERLEWFSSVIVEATDGEKILHCLMRHADVEFNGEPVWTFVAGPVEIR